MRIGILGGTFNPIHIGHLTLAREAARQLKLDKLIFVPSYLPPHKDQEGILDAEHRFKMVVLAITGNPKFEVSRIEVDLKQKAYSIDTLRKLKDQYGAGAEFFFITGSDSLKELATWKERDEMFKLSTFVVVKRPGFPMEEVPSQVQAITMAEMDISSTEIRKRLKGKKGIEDVVPDAAREYIKKNGLYI
ncbi:MAG: nicotinate-nucleotide adenylyltransferase [Candidatus Omnitrophica bacterium]|nr:nicotinate-nucleotide adenylyltransferase [Candidatus Omnitrophota bacterium]